MPAPASPLRIHTSSTRGNHHGQVRLSADAARRSAPSFALELDRNGVTHRLATDGDGGRMQALAGALFLLALTLVSGSLLYSFARGPSAPPLISASSH